MKIATSLILLACVFINGFAQNLKKELPNNIDVKTGKTEGGVTYYLYPQKDVKTVDFYLFVNAGAIDERDDQNGLAHFFEHMAFNGLKHFPDNQVIKFCDNNGISFGSQLNAFTAQSETMFELKKVPTKNKFVLDSCITILSDWSHGIMLEPEQVEMEKGVIIEEHRERNGIQAQMLRQFSKDLYNNTIYSKRDIIGDMDIIRSASSDDLREYYKTHYTPKNQAIFVIGNFDIEDIEAQIKRKFASFVDGSTNNIKKERSSLIIPDNEGISHNVFEHPQITNNVYSIVVRLNKRFVATKTVEDLKTAMIQSLFNQMMRSRINQLTIAKKNEFVSATISKRGYTVNSDLFSMDLVAKAGKDLAALQSVIDINQDVLMNGFSKTELLRAKAELQLQLQSNLSKGDNYINIFKEHFLFGTQMTTNKYKIDKSIKLLSSLTIEDLKQDHSKWFTETNMMLLSATGPKVKNELIGKEQLLQLMGKSEGTINVNVDVSDKKLLNKIPKAGKIVKVENLSQFGAEKWTLSNGATVFYRYNSIPGNLVFFHGRADGGRSVLTPKHLPAADYVTGILSLGLGDHDKVELESLLRHRQIKMMQNVEEYAQTINGQSIKDDFISLMQVVYMMYEKPRFDQVRLQTLINQEREDALRLADEPLVLMQDSISILNTNNGRYIVRDADYFDKITPETIEDLYRKFYSNPSAWNYFIVGDINKKQAKKMVETYLASINVAGQFLKPVERYAGIPSGQNTSHFNIVTGQSMGSLTRTYEMKLEHSIKNNLLLQLSGYLLTQRLMDVIREEEGGTYGVTADPNIVRLPYSKYGLSINFKCDPERLEELKGRMIEQIEGFGESITEEELKQIGKIVLDSQDGDQNSTLYWFSILTDYMEYNENNTSVKPIIDEFNKITIDEWRNFINNYFNEADCLDIIVKSK